MLALHTHVPRGEPETQQLEWNPGTDLRYTLTYTISIDYIILVYFEIGILD